MNPLTIRRGCFWGAVCGAAVLTPFGLQIVAHRWPQAGLVRFLSFTYGTNGASS